MKLLLITLIAIFFSAPALALAQETLPQPVVKAVSQGADPAKLSVKVTWTVIPAGNYGFKIERENGGQKRIIGTIDPPPNPSDSVDGGTVSDGQVTNGTTYIYSVTTVKKDMKDSLPGMASPVKVTLKESDDRPATPKASDSQPGVTAPGTPSTPATPTGSDSVGEVKVTTALGTFSSVGEYLSVLVKTYALPIAVVAALLMVTYAGWQYIGSGGSSDQTEQAKEIIIGAILGLITLVIMGYVLALIFPADSAEDIPLDTATSGTDTGSTTTPAGPSSTELKTNNEAKYLGLIGPTLTQATCLKKPGYVTTVTVKEVNDYKVNICYQIVSKKDGTFQKDLRAQVINYGYTIKNKPITLGGLKNKPLPTCNESKLSQKDIKIPVQKITVTADIDVCYKIVSVATTTSSPTTPTTSALQLTSSAFQNNGSIPAQYTCKGGSKGILLAIGGTLQAKTQTFSLLIDDPDAPDPTTSTKTYIHWSLTAIPRTTKAITTGTVPSGAKVVKSYEPPCPPSGTHHYRFTLTEVDTQGKPLKSTQLTGTFNPSSTSAAPTTLASTDSALAFHGDSESPSQNTTPQSCSAGESLVDIIGKVLSVTASETAKACPFSLQNHGKCPAELCRYKPLNQYEGRNQDYAAPKAIVYHFLGGPSTYEANAAWNGFNNSMATGTKVRYVHFVINRDGTIYQFLPETKVGAGATTFNTFQGGTVIHIENTGCWAKDDPDCKKAGVTQPTTLQIQANRQLSAYLMSKWNIRKSNIYQHADVQDKTDTGAAFRDTVKKCLPDAITTYYASSNFANYRSC